jgi:membrane protease YdiL (CAAX protease family)
VFSWARLPFFLQQFALMFPMCFVLEEVAFRGALDPHLAPSPVRWRFGWVSAVFVSAMWGLWHLPLQSFGSPAECVRYADLDLGVHVLIGVPLSFCWRTSGTLVLPCAAHGLIDAFRNAIFS